MKLKLDMSCRLLNVYTKFQIDILKQRKNRTDGRKDIATVWYVRFSSGRVIKLFFTYFVLYFVY